MDVWLIPSDLGFRLLLSGSLFVKKKKKKPPDLLRLARLLDAKPADIPLELTVKYCKDEGTPLDDPWIYRCLIGSLNYLTATHSDISHVVNIFS